MNLKKKKKGFTLIELMAVIAIIAILAAVLVPTVTGYINKSKKTAVISQVRTVVNAIETYNATASDTISEDSTEINDTIRDLLKDEKLLGDKDTDRLGEMTVAQAYDISKSTAEQQMIKVKLDKDGKYDPNGE